MELKLLEKSDDSIRIEVVNPDDTLLYPLINELLKDKRVEEARYAAGHPFLDKPKIYIKVKEGKPQTALKRAAENLSGRFRECRELFEKAIT